MRDSKRGFTLVELLVVLAILGVLFALGVTAIGGCAAKPNAPFTAKVVNKYEFRQNGSIIFRVELQREGGGNIEVFENFDALFLNKQRDSATLQANLLVGQYYLFETVGNHNYSTIFPNIISASKVPR